MQEEKKLTMEDVANALGVSKTTVSRAISGKGRIGEATRKRVMDYMEQHCYKPHQAADKAPASGNRPASLTYNIGMALPQELLSLPLPFFPQAFQGVSEAAAKEGYDIILLPVGKDGLPSLARAIQNRKVDGLLLMRMPQDGRLEDMLKKSGLPFVMAGMPDVPGACQVDHDHAEACRELTGILLMKGLLKIAVVAGNMDDAQNRRRLEGFYKAHQESGLALDESLVFTGVDSEMLAGRATEAILTRGADCIIGADDLLASYVLKKLEEEKVQIPKDMRFASFYDSELLKTVKAGITAIQFHTQELGREACKLLLRQMHGEEAPRMTKLSYEVAMRESTK